MPLKSNHIAALKGKPAPVLLVDATGLVFRAFFSIRELTSPSGLPVNAVIGVLKMLLKVVADVEPQGCAAFFDTARRSFRSEQFPEYKAQRPPPPDTLIPQIPMVIEGLEACGCPTLLEPGYEADDLIASFAAQHPAQFKLVLSGDKDLLQLVDENTYVLVQSRGVTELRVYTPESFRGEYGFAPALFVDHKALRGDPSDNIPGVKSIGEKTAQKLIAQFGGLEGIYGRLEEVKPERIRQALAAARDEVFRFRELVRLKSDCELPPEQGRPRLPQFGRAEFLAYLDKYGLRAIRQQLVGANVLWLDGTPGAR